MKITKTLAAEIAKQALKHVENKYDSDYESFKALNAKALTDNTPESVKKCPKDWLDRATYVKFRSDDISVSVVHDSFQLKRELPVRSGGYGSFVTLPDATYQVLIAEKTRLKNVWDQYNSDLAELETALLQLGTSKRVIDTFPELKQYIPLETTTALVPNYDKIKDLLKQ